VSEERFFLLSCVFTVVLSMFASSAALADPFVLAQPAVTLDAQALVAALAQDAPSGPVLADPDLPPAAPKQTPSPGMAALKSLVLPGWGQIATGHKTQAAIFLGLEAASWASWITFKNQGAMREDSYIETARIYANVDLEGQDEEMRRNVGQYQSNEVYNQYIVRRDAAYFIEDPAEQEQYIADHELHGAQAWHWTYFEDFERYGEQRRSSEAAYHNAEFVVGFAIVNRLVSAAMAAKQASSLRKAAAAESSALPGRPDGRLAWGVSSSLNGPLEGRVGWTVGF